MKLVYDGNNEFDNLEDLKDFVLREISTDVLEEFLDETYEGYEDNLNEWSPSDLYTYICKDGLESVRDDPDLFDYLMDSADFYDFDPDDYEDGQVVTIGDLEFTVVFEEGDTEKEEDE